jgi:predicted alpha/beta superfamily hydrolase
MPPPLAATMAGTETHSIHSAILDAELQIDVSLPIGYESSRERYPAVYLLDGYWHFPIVSHAVRPLEATGELPQFIVVGIAYKPGNESRSQYEDERLVAGAEKRPAPAAWHRDRTCRCFPPFLE